MTTKTVGAPRIFGQGQMNDFPVIASDIIYEGSAVGENASGYSRPLVAGDPFQGFSVRDADNSSGAAGAINVRVIMEGIVCNLPVTGATAVTANDMPKVYASDDNAFTLTQGSNTWIGVIVRWVSSGVADVYFNAMLSNVKIQTSQIEAEAVTTAEMADLARGSILSGQTASNRPTALDAKGDAKILIGDGTDLNSVAVSGDITITNAGVTTIGAGAVDKAMLAATVRPSHMVVYAGRETTTGGGGATEAHTVTGIVAATDFVHVTLEVNGTNNVTIVEYAITDNTITVTFSADPGNDATYIYSVLRATS